MNFFTNWGKLKQLSINKSSDNVSNLVDADTTQRTITPITGSGSRPHYKTKNRRKNFLFTRSLWYDTEKDSEETTSKLKKAQSFDNLESSFQEEFSSLNIISNRSNSPESRQYFQEATPNSTLKKSFSLENVSWKGTIKGKPKGVMTKEMISHPIDLRKITDGSQFPSFEPFEKIAEENNLNFENGEIVVSEHKSSMELVLEKNDSCTQHFAVELRRSCSMKNVLPIKEIVSFRKSSCPNAWLETKVPDQSLLFPETNVNTSSFVSDEHHHNNVTVSSCELDLVGENLEKRCDETNNNIIIDENSSDIDYKSTEGFSSDCVDGGTLRKHAKQMNGDVTLRNRKERPHIMNEEEIIKENIYFVSYSSLFC